MFILKVESYFDVVLNFVDGSYYLEKFIEEFVEKVLNIFKDIENGGGFLK